MRKVIIVGGGAAGMMAAVAAAKGGAQVDLYEKNEKTGKKIYITGKGRCNLTNACGEEDFFTHICHNGKFMYSSFYGFTNTEAIAFFEENGCPVKVERGERAFPVSDHSSDVIAALNRAMRRSGVRVHLNEEVERIEPVGAAAENGAEPEYEGWRIKLKSGKCDEADALIIATGGLSYPSTGSTGDGMAFARREGLKVTECMPALVPMETAEADILSMQGLSLKNVTLTVKKGKKKLYDGFGEMMFTHFGITGPLVLSASSLVGEALKKQGTLEAEIDLKPALSDEQLDARLLREFDAGINKQISNILGSMLPAKMVPVMIARSGIAPEKKAHDMTRADRARLIDNMRHFRMTITGLRGFKEAIITKGGVHVKQIRPDTMEVKEKKGLYFAGEVLDVDAVTGGFNLQIAWSTGYAAGCAAAREEEHEF